jgi:hypothetical protein
VRFPWQKRPDLHEDIQKVLDQADAVRRDLLVLARELREINRRLSSSSIEPPQTGGSSP